MAEPCCENPSSTRNLRPAAAPPPAGPVSQTLSRVDLARPSGGDLPGRFVGDYEVLGELGRGGMGVVYKARHRGLGRVVALKMVLGSRFARVEELLRFRLEGEAAASLQHPNIVQLFEVGTHQDQPYLVLEYVEGGTLSGRIRQGRLTAEQSTRLVEALAGAVQVAHNQGIVHRDLKPGNVLLATDGTPKITDFGLAKQMDRGAAGLTETGRVLGTPQYMAPEQAAGRSRDVGPHTDLYALGAILYDLVAGRPPFVAGESADTLIQVLTCEPIPPRRLDASVPRDLETVVLKCLEKDPRKRYASARDLADDLARFREGRPILARPVGPVERAWKWARRRPVVAALVASLVLVSVLGFAGVSAALVYAVEGWRQAREQRDLAEAEKEKAERERGEAQTQRDRARAAGARAETGAAFNRLARALLEWRQNNLGASATLLSQIDEGRRGWEWHYLRALHHGELMTLSRPALARAPGLAFRPDGEHLAVAGGNPFGRRRDGTEPSEVSVWDVRTGALVRVLTGFKRAAFQVAYSPDGRWLAACSDDECVRVWDAATGVLVRAVREKVGSIHDLSWGRDGKHVFASCASAGIKGWDVATGEPVAWLKREGGDGQCVAISPDGRSLVGCASGTRLWDVGTGALRWRVPTACQKVAFSPDGRVLACASGALILLRSAADGRELRSLAGHQGSVQGLAFSPCGQLLVTGGSDSTVRLWDVEEGQELSVWRGHEARVEAVAFHPGGAMVASGGAQPGEVKLWDLTRMQEFTRVFEPAHYRLVNALAFSPGGGEVLVARAGGLVESRDVASGRPTLSRELPMTSVWRTPGALAAFSGDTRVLAGLTATDDRRVRAWEARSGERLAGSFRHAVPAWHVAASADGRLVASAAFGVRGDAPHDEVAVWEPATGGVVMKLDRANLVTGCLALSPDGSSLARGVGHFTSETSPQGQTTIRLVRVGVEVWGVPGREPRLELPIGRYVPRGVAFSGDGGLLAACDAGGDVYVWETATGRRLHEEPLRGPAGVEGLAFRPDGRLLAGVNRNEVTIWDLREGLEVIRLRGAQPRPSDGGFSPRVAWSGDGRRLAASNWDQSVTVWDSADLATPDAKGGLRRAAHDRLPRWHLKSAATALGRRRADAVRFHLDQIERRGELEPAWRLTRGDLLGRMGEWEKARRDYEAVAPDYGGFPAEVVRARLALMAWKGDRVEYTRLAAALLDGGAAGTVENSAVHTAMACCLFPGAVARPDSLLAPLRELVSPERAQAGLQLALALACLRAGRPGEAVEAGERALAVSHGEPWVVKTSARIVLALAHHRSGRPDDAGRHWRKAREEMAEVRERMAAEGLLIAPHIAWWDWLTVQTLEREAQSELGRSG